MVIGTHMVKQQSDWPKLFRMASQTIGPKIPDHSFQSHFGSGNGGMGTRLYIH